MLRYARGLGHYDVPDYTRLDLMLEKMARKFTRAAHTFACRVRLFGDRGQQPLVHGELDRVRARQGPQVVHAVLSPPRQP